MGHGVDDVDNGGGVGVFLVGEVVELKDVVVSIFLNHYI